MADEDDCAQVKASFRALDRNGDGKISKDELSSYFLGEASEWTQEEVDELFAGVDVEKDGLISYEEFVDWVMQAPKDSDVYSSIRDLASSQVGITSTQMDTQAKLVKATLALLYTNLADRLRSPSSAVAESSFCCQADRVCGPSKAEEASGLSRSFPQPPALPLPRALFALYYRRAAAKLLGVSLPSSSAQGSERAEQYSLGCLARHFLGNYSEADCFRRLPYQYFYDEEVSADVFLHETTGVKIWQRALDLRSIGSGTARALFYYGGKDQFRELVCLQENAAALCQSLAQGEALHELFIYASRQEPTEFAANLSPSRSIDGDSSCQYSYCIPVLASDDVLSVLKSVPHGGNSVHLNGTGQNGHDLMVRLPFSQLRDEEDWEFADVAQTSQISLTSSLVKPAEAHNLESVEASGLGEEQAPDRGDVEKAVEYFYSKLQRQKEKDRQAMERSSRPVSPSKQNLQDTYLDSTKRQLSRSASMKHLSKHATWTEQVSSRLDNVVLRCLVALQHYVDLDLDDLYLAESERRSQDAFDGDDGSISRQMILDATRSSFTVDGEAFEFSGRGVVTDSQARLDDDKRQFTERLVGAVRKCLGGAEAPAELIKAVTNTMSQTGMSHIERACAEPQLVISGGDQLIHYELVPLHFNSWLVKLFVHKFGFDRCIVYRRYERAESVQDDDTTDEDIEEVECSPASSTLKTYTVCFSTPSSAQVQAAKEARGSFIWSYLPTILGGESEFEPRVEADVIGFRSEVKLMDVKGRPLRQYQVRIGVADDMPRPTEKEPSDAITFQAPESSEDVVETESK